MKRSLHFTAPLLAIGYQLSALSAHAHPGHGPGEVPPAHLLTNADHLGALLSISVICFCLLNARRWFNRNPQAP
jgi:hydrogenase/urease accessory protein HupE